MPVALDSNEIYRYVLSTDRGKEKPPTLLFYYPTCRETRQIANLFDQSDKASGVDEMINLSCDAIRIILCGWENVTTRDGTTVSYQPENVDAILTESDITEVRANLLRDMGQSEVEKKVRAFSVQSSSGQSAKNVTEGSA